MNAPELKRFALLAGLDETGRDELANELEIRVLDAGAVVFEEGDPADGLVLVATGELRVASARSGASAHFGPGAALGAFSLVAGGQRESSAVTRSRSRLLLLDCEGYRRLVSDAPRTACALLEAIVIDCAAAVRDGLDGEQEHATSDGIDPAQGSH